MPRPYPTDSVSGGGAQHADILKRSNVSLALCFLGQFSLPHPYTWAYRGGGCPCSSSTNSSRVYFFKTLQNSCYQTGTTHFPVSGNHQWSPGHPAAMSFLTVWPCLQLPCLVTSSLCASFLSPSPPETSSTHLTPSRPWPHPGISQPSSFSRLHLNFTSCIST